MYSMCSNIGTAKKKLTEVPPTRTENFASRSEGGISKFSNVLKSGECPAKLHEGAQASGTRTISHLEGSGRMLPHSLVPSPLSKGLGMRLAPPVKCDPRRAVLRPLDRSLEAIFFVKAYSKYKNIILIIIVQF